MAASNLSTGERRRAELVVREVTEPALGILLDSGKVVDGIREATVRDAFEPLMLAAVELQAGGERATDAAFERFGGPGPDSVGRLFRGADLSDLPGAQLRSAMDAQLVPPPGRIVVEARTEPTTGPAKFGCVHLSPPPALRDLFRGPVGAPNTRGGIASAIALADCDPMVLPCGEVPIQQGYWQPDAWPKVDRAEIERRIRAAGGYYGDGLDFVTRPEDAARQLIGRMQRVDRLCAWDVRFDGLVIAGGRLRLGFPRAGRTELGAGRETRYIGANLAALQQIRDAGFVPFFELPQRTRGPGRAAAGTEEICDWVLQVGEERLDLAAAEELLFAPNSPWRLIDPALVARVANPAIRAWRLPATASSQAVSGLNLQLVMLADAKVRTDLFVTTMDVPESDQDAEGRLVRLSAEETGRRQPESKLERSVRSLLLDGEVQTNQRRLYPDRRSFAGLSLAAFGVLEIVRHGGALPGS